MEEKRLISIIDPEGNVSTVEYVIELFLDDKDYLIYNKNFDEDKDEIDLFIVKLLSNNNGYYIENIKDESEYIKVSKRVEELIGMEGA